MNHRRSNRPRPTRAHRASGLLRFLSTVLLMAAVVSSLAGHAAGQTLLAPPPGPVIVTRGPYLQIGTPNSIVVRWRTGTATDSRVRYGTAIGSLSSIKDDLVGTTEHEVGLTGLSPNTRYYYSIGSTTQVLEGDDANHSFITFPPP